MGNGSGKRRACLPCLLLKQSEAAVDAATLWPLPKQGQASGPTGYEVANTTLERNCGDPKDFREAESPRRSASCRGSAGAATVCPCPQHGAASEQSDVAATATPLPQPGQASEHPDDEPDNEFANSIAKHSIAQHST